MNNLQMFNNPEFGSIRTTTINNEPYFVGKDIADVLGYSNPLKAIRDHIDEEDKGVNEMDTPGGTQQIIVINESGLYSLILGSKLPTAKKFKHWVTSEVLPAIRKTGGYINGQGEMSDEELMAKALEVAHRTIAERDARISQLSAENSRLVVDKQIMQPKADYFDELVDRNLLTNFTEAAKQLGVKRKDLINFALDHSYIYRDKKGNILPRANRKADGLFQVKQCGNEKTGWAGCQTLLTPKGVETFRLLMEGRVR